MATTTTNYGFDIPQSTDLVKDGATAIATLGQDIDTAMNTALGTKKAGMVLLNTTSFSAVASQSLPTDTFTSSYTNYKIMCSIITSTNADLFLRLRAAGSDQSGSNYAFQPSLITTALSVNRASGQTSIRLTNNNAATYPYVLEIDLFDPKGAGTTQINGTGYQFFSNILMGGSYEANYSADSATILPNTGTLTGTIWCFGYNK